MVHWSHPMFLGYFGWTTTAPAILGEIITAPLNVNAMTWRTCPAATELETRRDRLDPAMDAVCRKNLTAWFTTRRRSGVMHALAVAREEAAPSSRKLGLAGRGVCQRFAFTLPIKRTARPKKRRLRSASAKKTCSASRRTRDFRMDPSAAARNDRARCSRELQTAGRHRDSRHNFNRER